MTRTKTPYLPTYCGRQPPGSVPHLPTYCGAAQRSEKYPFSPSVNRLRGRRRRTRLGWRPSRRRLAWLAWPRSRLNAPSPARAKRFFKSPPPAHHHHLPTYCGALWGGHNRTYLPIAQGPASGNRPPIWLGAGTLAGPREEFTSQCRARKELRLGGVLCVSAEQFGGRFWPCAKLPLCAARSRRQETWPPMRLALARRASVPQPLRRASGRPGAALLARCTAQSCDNKGRLLSLGVGQCSCGRSWAAVQW